MINPHLANQRTGYHLDIFNKSAHYLRLLNSKPIVDSVWSPGEYQMPTKGKMLKSLEMSRENRKIVDKVQEIGKIDPIPDWVRGEGSEKVSEESVRGVSEGTDDIGE